MNLTGINSGAGYLVPDTSPNAFQIQTRSSGVSHGGPATLNTFAGVFKGNTNWVDLQWLPCGVDSVRIRILSDVADTSTYTGVTMTCQTTDLSGGLTQQAKQNPYLQGVLQTMTPVTWANGAASPTFPSGGTPQAPIPIWSDWIPVNHTGAGISYLIVKTYYPSGVASGGGYVDCNQYGGRIANLAALGIQEYHGTLVGASAVASNTTNWVTSNAALPLEIQFSARQRVPSLVHNGDSTKAGYKSLGLVAASERYAIARSLRGLPTAVVNMGCPGQTPAQYQARMAAFEAAGSRFDVLVHEVGSPNDPIATAYGLPAAQRAMAFTGQAITLANRSRSAIVLEGPFPMTAIAPTAGQTLFIQAIRDYVAAMNKIGPNVSAVFYDELHMAGSYGRWIPEYNEAQDYLHQSDLASNRVIIPNFTNAVDAVIGA